jgi:hypothetical protein
MFLCRAPCDAFDDRVPVLLEHLGDLAEELVARDEVQAFTFQ